MASHRVLLTNYLSRKALLRNSDFDIPTFNTIICGKHSLRYQGSHIRSKLDNKLKGSSNIESQFKKNIRKKDLTLLLNNNKKNYLQIRNKENLYIIKICSMYKLYN